MPEVFYKKPLGNAFTRMVAKRWTFLAREQRFFIRSPTFYAPKILDAASQKVPTIAECAALLLVVGEAAGLSWPPNMLASLNELTQTGNSGAEITNKN
jgi:hypothetical protein